MLKIYDITIDDHREVTQADIDRLMATEQAYGKLRAFVAQTHGELLVEIGLAMKRNRPVVDAPDIRAMEPVGGAVERAREALGGSDIGEE